MIRKIILVGLGFYLGYKFADGVEIETTYREPTVEEVVAEAMREGTAKTAETNAR